MDHNIPVIEYKWIYSFLHIQSFKGKTISITVSECIPYIIFHHP